MAMDIWSIETTMSMLVNGSKAINMVKVSSKMVRMEEFIEQCILKILLQELKKSLKLIINIYYINKILKY